MRPKKTFYFPILLLIAVLIPQLFSQANGKELVLFSPQDQPEKHLISYLEQAEEHIYAAVYVLTNKAITNALINAKKRNVDVQLIIDPATLDHKANTLEQLKEAGIDVFVYNPAPDDNSDKRPKGIMHHKFVLIDSFLWTGSFNWTSAANKYNRENVIISDDPNTFKRFRAEFEALKKDSQKQDLVL